MQQTGFLYEFDPRDYITGASPLAWDIVNKDGDWRNWKPLDEKQYDIKFDTMSCTTFSALNVIETWVNWLMYNDKLTVAQLEELNKLGFIENGKFNASDRFTAIMSGTTQKGNYFPSVWNSIKTDGLLPEKDFPYGGNNWNEYHNKSLITEAMKTKAKKILDILEFAYEWTPVTETSIELSEALKQAPVQVAVTKEAPQHAIMLMKMDWEFETYPPFLRPRNRTIAYAMKAQVKAKKAKYKYFTEKEVFGLKEKLVNMLDEAREIAGIPFAINSGYRTLEHNAEIGGVENSSHTLGLAVDLRARNSTEHFKITKALLQVGFSRISRKYPNHIHCDIDDSKPQEVLF